MKRLLTIISLVAFVFSLFPAQANSDDVVPVAENVFIDGVAYAGGKIKGTYEYVGVEDIEQGESRYRWLVSDTQNGEYQPLDGEESLDLDVTDKHLQKYIVFEVTPVGEDGVEGLPVLSEPVLEQSVPEVVFEETFNELDTDLGDGDGWFLTTAGGTVDVSEGNMLFTPSGNAGTTVGAERRFQALNGIFALEFTFSMSAKHATNFIYAYEGSAYVFNITSDANNIGVYVGNGGFESAKWALLLAGYQPNTEYHVTVLVNTETDRLSVAINDEWKLENAFLRKDVTNGVNKFLTAVPSNSAGVLSISQYNVIKYVKSPDLESVLSDVKLLNLDVEGGIEENLDLPVSGTNGSIIRWESSNPEVISNTGEVNRSTENDIDVTLTAFLQKGNSPEIPVVFNVKVLQFIMPAPQERINSSLLAIEMPQESITKDLTLATQGDFDVVIQWESSDEKIISSDGKVNRPSKDTYVTLTAIATAEDESDERNFTLLVKGKSSASGGSSGGSSGGGGSGGGGSSSGGSSKNRDNIVHVPPTSTKPSDEPVSEPRVVYTDLKDYEWAEESIMYLTDKSIVQGIGESLFAPHRHITREEFIHMIVNAFQIKKSDNIQMFDDVEKSSWYEQSVLAARNAGIVEGKGGNLFGVGEVVTRQDAVVMLYRVLKMKDADMYIRQESKFEDISEVSSYATEAVEVLWTNDIIQGDDRGCFNPKNNMKRAEACKMLYEALQIMQRR